MRIPFPRRFTGVITFFVGGFVPIAPVASAWNSALVPVEADGRLSYVADANGNRIPDFSHAGYRGGGVALPVDIPVVRTLSATVGDQTARIQAAIDEVAALPIQANGYRGTLLLAAGTYDVLGTLRLRASGIVLAGAGDGDDPATNTLLRRTGTSQAAIIQAGNRDDQFKSEIAGTRSRIVTAKVPVGARSFEVDHPEYYRVGDPVVVWHPSTQPWLDAVDRGGVTDENFWKPGEIDVRYHRYVTAISGGTVTVDAPVFMHLERALSQSYLYTYDASGMLTRLGIEKLQVDVVTSGELTEDHAEDAITFVGAEDSWIRDATAKHFWHAGVQWEGSTRCTAERCRMIEPHSVVTGGRRYNFSMYHSQLILVRDSFADRARHAYVCNGTSADSGVVFLNCVTDRALTSSEGHRRWSTGLLFDGLVATNRQSSDILGLYNRGTYGTGHGWSAAHSVAWNCNASVGGRIRIQKPPTAQNYGIGCSGTITGSGPFAGAAGVIEGANQTGLAPASLYLAQLNQRLADAQPPVIVTAPASLAVAPDASARFSVAATGAGLAYQWKWNGAAVAFPGATGATSETLTIGNVQPAHAGAYTATVTNAAGIATTSQPAILGVATMNKVLGAGAEVGSDIAHPSGNIYDQILLQGAAAAITADPGQVTRISFVDLNDDIVQVEFAGAGALSLVLDQASGPAAPVNYNQPAVVYMKGHAGIVIVGADETTNVSVFSVGRANAVNQALFKAGVAYDGLADIAFVAVQSAAGKFAGLRAANASCFATSGVTGVHAPGVRFGGPVFVGDISAFEAATPAILLGAAADARITGGDLFQTNGRAVQVSGLTQLRFVAGTTSHGVFLSAKTNRARLEDNGVDVSALIAVDPEP